MPDFKVGMVDVAEFELLLRQFKNIQMDNGEVQYSEDGVYIQYFPDDDPSDSGTAIKWAKITAVTDANNYTVDVWNSRTSYVNGDTASETSKQLRVPDIVDELAVNDAIGVESTTLTGEDYIAVQQLGALG